MANTFTQLYVQLVFAVKGRQSLIPKEHKERLHQYITGIVRNRDQKLLAIHCMPDHTHLFVGFRPTLCISDLMRDVKSQSSIFIREQKITPYKFEWQEGYGAFTYAQSQVDAVYKYIQNQEKHHQKRTFKEEYLDFLKKFNVEYDEKYVFEWLE
jgi:putative transposase